jgi:hypothetical protein
LEQGQPAGHGRDRRRRQGRGRVWAQGRVPPAARERAQRAQHQAVVSSCVCLSLSLSLSLCVCGTEELLFFSPGSIYKLRGRFFLLFFFFAEGPTVHAAFSGRPLSFETNNKHSHQLSCFKSANCD